MSKILVLNGNLKAESFCRALADRYGSAATSAGHQVERLDIAELQMDFAPPDYSAKTKPSADWVAHVQSSIERSDHLVIVTPLWWGGPPAALKALLDRVLMPGFAFKYRDCGVMWDRLLQNRTARVVLTMDSPNWYFDWVLSRPMVRQFKVQILEFCGFKPVRFTTLGPVKTSTARQRENWLRRVGELGARGR